MSVRRAIVEADLDGLNVTEFCRHHGVSTWFFYELRRRFAREGESALELRSRAPRRVANRTSEELRDRIVAVRKRLAEAGFDNGPSSIRSALLADDSAGTVPSEATIWRVLTERGFITPAPNKAPKHAHRSFAASRANECWQIDATGWALAEGTVVEIIDIVDDCTRVAVGSVAVTVCTAAAAWDALCGAAATWGWPARVLSDNGSAFRGHVRLGGGAFEANLAALGIRAGHSRPHHPQTCGKVERYHQTLKRFLAAHDRPADVAGLQGLLDVFVDHYNHRRPHRSLGRRTPAAVWAATPRSGPDRVAVGTPTRVYRGVVSRGRLFVSNRSAITVGARYNGRRGIAVVTGLHAHVFIDGKLARALTIDPERRYQTLYDRPGRP